ncbi:hypothetical protein ACWDV4_29255 [Micromonospora sp. NPDC003197]
MTEPSERAGQPGQDPPPPPPITGPPAQPWPAGQSAQPWPDGSPAQPWMAGQGAQPWAGGHPAPPPNRKRRTWLIAAVAAWAALLLVVTYLSVRWDEPTVREQRDIAQASKVVDRALGELVVAAGPDVAVELTAPRLVQGCRLSLIRDGATLERDVVFRTVEAQEQALLDRIAQGLPADYRARIRPSKGTLRADAGEFVGIKGGLTEPGTVKLTTGTGCRPLPTGYEIAELMPGQPIDDEPGRVLAALGVSSPAPVDRASAPCPGSGLVRTVWAVGRGAVSTPLATALRPFAGADAVVVIDQTDRYAYRSGSRSLMVEALDGEVRVAVTESGCAG